MMITVCKYEAVLRWAVGDVQMGESFLGLNEGWIQPCFSNLVTLGLEIC